MTDPQRIDDLEGALARRELPTVGLWNRLEGRPRTTDFGRALRAEVRDPLWMLTRQWQLGEFRGADAGSPVTAMFHVEVTTPSRFRPGDGAVQDLPPDRPLEAIAERRLVPFAIGDDPISFDLRLAIGRRWLKLVGQSLILNLFNVRDQYVARYPIALPDPGNDADSPRVAHPEVWSAMQTVAGRRMDGYKFYLHLKSGRPAHEGISGLLGLHRNELTRLGTRLVNWFERLIDQPTGNASWDPRRLEHRISVAVTTDAGDEKVLTAQEYPGGELDWHAFSVDPGGPLGGTRPADQPVTTSAFPSPVRFSGMPLPRWWALEDGGTNFAAVRPDSTDLARLVFLEFALVYSNDWFLLPCDLPAGALASVRGLVVTDVFGQRRWINPAGAGDDEDWQRWAMFNLDTIGDDEVPADTSLFLPASVPKIAEGPVLEGVTLIRDEQVNMVWGIEQTVRLATGPGRRGSEVAAEILAHRQRRFFPPQPPADPLAPISYQAMTTVPENWIPFIPVHVAGDNREIQLQRAAMTGVDGNPVRPRTDLMRSTPAPYFVNEEEVPRTGTRLTAAFNRTRWRDGRVAVWLSAARGTGRGEGSSGLAFDHLLDTPVENQGEP